MFYSNIWFPKGEKAKNEVGEEGGWPFYIQGSHFSQRGEGIATVEGGATTIATFLFVPL